jgi:hypothetical protein
MALTLPLRVTGGLPREDLPLPTASPRLAPPDCPIPGHLRPSRVCLLIHSQIRTPRPAKFRDLPLREKDRAGPRAGGLVRRRVAICRSACLAPDPARQQHCIPTGSFILAGLQLRC